MRHIRYIIMTVLLAVAGNTLADGFYVQDLSMLPNEEKAVSFEFEATSKQYIAFEFRLVLPAGMNLAKDNNGEIIALLNASRINDHTLDVEEEANNTYHFLCYSINNYALTGNSGELISLSIVTDQNYDEDGTATITDQVFMDINKQVVKFKNYTFGVTVEKAFTLTADNITMAYGDNLPELTYNVVGSNITGTPQMTCDVTPTSPVGTYPIIVSRGGITNRNGTYVNGTLTITKAPLNISVGNYTRKQGEQNPDFEVSYDGFKNGEDASVLTKQPTATTTAQPESTPGSYPITVSGAEAQNYDISYTNGTLTVNQAAPITITANNITMVYGDAVPELTYKTEGAALSGTPQISCDVTSSSPVGTYTIVISKGSVTNYNDTYINGTLTITKAPLNISVGNYTRKQGEQNPDFEVLYDGFKNGEDVSVLTKLPTATTTALPESAPGSYPITVSGAEAQNYDISYTNGTLTIQSFSPVISFSDANVKAICVANWDTNGDGELSEAEAAAVTSLGTVFKENANIISFDELQYFTGLTSIGDRAFYFCTGMTTITIPNSVKSIGGWAFYGCSGLTSITIPNSVTSIGNDAFSNCSSLASVTIPYSVTSIGGLAFDNCHGLTSINVDTGNTIYDSRNNCNAIIETASNTLIAGCKNTIIPNSVTSIGKKAFSSCSGLTFVTIPNSVTNIGNFAFSGCSSLTSFIIPNSVTSIGDMVFLLCSGLTSMTVEDGNRVYDSRDNCNAIIATASNTLIAGCKNTIIPNSVTSIGDYAFRYCRGLTTVTIPNSLTSIGGWTFEGCSDLTSVTIGNSVISIGDYAFGGCDRLTSVTVLNPTPVAVSQKVFSNRTKSTLYVPAGSAEAYQTADVWKDFKEIKEIDNRADQTLVLSELPEMIVGENSFVLPSTTTEGLALKWAVADVIIASVNGNQLTPLKAGTTTVTATQTGNNNYLPFMREFTLIVNESITTGDLNNDGIVNIVDIMNIIDVMSGENTDSSMSLAADLNGDGKVNILDIMAAIDIMAGQTGNQSANKAPRRISSLMTNDNISAKIKENAIDVILDNENDYSAFQMLVTLLDGCGINDIRLNSDRADRHQVTWREIGDNKYFVAGFSLSNKKINGNYGNLMSISVNNLNGEVMISDVVFATPDKTAYQLNDVFIQNVDTGIETVDYKVLKDSDVIYDLQGRRVSGNLKRGIYIVNGKKIAIK